MENLLNSLKRENKERERRLNVSDKKLLSDMVGYMKTQKICDYDIEQVRKTIIRNTLRSYNKRKNLETLSGGDYREYCHKLCENMRHASTKELVLSRGVTIIYALALMYLVRLADTLMAGSNFLKNPVEINMGYLTATAAILLGTILIFLYAPGILKTKSNRMSISQMAGLLVLIAVIIVAAYGGVFFLSDIHVLDIQWWIPVVVIAVLWALFKILYIQYENQMAKEA